MGDEDDRCVFPCHRLKQEEDKRFVPVLCAFLPNPYKTTAEAIHKCYGDLLKPFLEKGVDNGYIPCRTWKPGEEVEEGCRRGEGRDKERGQGAC